MPELQNPPPIPAATVETAAQREARERRCPLHESCTEQNPTAGVPITDHHKLALAWTKHQRQHHAGQGAAFKERAAGKQWAGRTSLCPHTGCGMLYIQNSHTRHAQRCAYRPVNPVANAPVGNHAPELPADGTRYTWGLPVGSTARTLLHGIPVQHLLQHELPVSRKLKAVFAPLFAEALVYVLRQLKAATTQGDMCLAAGWSKLWHLLPCLLLCPDGRISRERRFRHFAAGHIPFLVDAALAFARRRAASYHRKQHTPDSASVASLARQSGGLKRAAARLRAATHDAPPRNDETLQKLRDKHPDGDAQAALLQAEADGWALVHANPPALALYDDVFTDKSLAACIRAADKTTAPGVAGLSVQHLQVTLQHGTNAHIQPLLTHLVWLARTLYGTPQALCDAFKQLHAAARMFGVGAKVRPIACGCTLRRLFARMFCRKHSEHLGSILAPAGQYGCGSPGGTDIVATTAQLLHDAGGILLSIDGANAFNSLSRCAMYRGVAKHMPALYPYVVAMYGPAAEPALVFAKDGEELAELTGSKQGIQQGDGLGPLLWGVSTLDTHVRFKEDFPELAGPTFLDDTFIGSTGTEPVDVELARMSNGFVFFKQQMSQIGVQINEAKSLCVLPKDPGRAAYVREALQTSAVPVAEGAVVVGVPVGPQQYVQRQAESMLLDDEGMRLLRGIVSMQEADAQVAYALLRMSYVPSVMHLMRNVPPSLLTPALHKFDALSLSALAALLQEPSAVEFRAAAAPDAPASDWDAAVAMIMHRDWDGDLPVTFSDEQRQQLRLRHRDGGLGIMSAATHACAAYAGRSISALCPAFEALPAPVLAAVVAALPQSTVLTGIRTCTQSMLTAGVQPDQLEELLQSDYWRLQQGDSQPLLQSLQQPDQRAELRQLPAHLQAKLSNLLHTLSKTQFWDAIRPEEQAQQGQQPDAALVAKQVAAARWLSQSTKGAMACFGVHPSTDADFRFASGVFRETARRALGEERPDPGGICGNNGCTEIATAAHSRSCVKGREYTVRHDLCVRAMESAARKETRLQGVEVERSDMFVAHTGQALRMDIVIQADQLNTAEQGKAPNLHLGQLVDHTYPDGTASKYRARAAQTAGYAATLAAEGKHTKYRGRFAADQYTFLPFAVDQFGAACSDAHRLIRALALRQSQNSGGVWPLSQCVARWRQRMSVALQRALSESVARTLARCTEPSVAGGDRPNFKQYLAVKLLVP